MDTALIVVPSPGASADSSSQSTATISEALESFGVVSVANNLSSHMFPLKLKFSYLLSYYFVDVKTPVFDFINDFSADMKALNEHDYIAEKQSSQKCCQCTKWCGSMNRPKTEWKFMTIHIFSNISQYFSFIPFDSSSSTALEIIKQNFISIIFHVVLGRFMEPLHLVHW